MSVSRAICRVRTKPSQPANQAKASRLTLCICGWQVPAPFDLEAITKAKASDPSALHVVLLQELERYNALLASMRRSCSELQKGLKGVVVMSADLDDIANALFANKVGLRARSSTTAPLQQDWMLWCVCRCCVAGHRSKGPCSHTSAVALAYPLQLHSCLAPQQMPGALQKLLP